MGVAACLKWEPYSRMANLTTTHRHDYRWPGQDCLIPKAEAPNGQCEVRSGTYGSERRYNQWCGRDAPQPLPPTEPPVCRDLVPTPVHRPWCQRGPLVPRISPPPRTAPAEVRGQPPGCEVTAPARPWCEGGAEPRPVSARVGAAPQQDSSRYDQPNQYLSKLCDKYPQPTSVISASPRDELMRRVYADRYRTTYQSDYCTNADDTARLLGKCDTHDVDNHKAHNYYNGNDFGHPPTQPMTEGTNMPTTCKCGCGCRLAQQSLLEARQSGDTDRVRPIACRPAAVSHNVHFSCCSPKKPVGSSGGSAQGEEVGPPQKLPPWITEYTDSIGKTGQIIMDQRLHYPSKKKKLH